MYTASKIPPKNFRWPAKPLYSFEDSYPGEHIRAFTEEPLKNLKQDQIDLMQFHTWDDGLAIKE